MDRQIFVNLPVQDLQRSTAFFTELGFRFNDHYTNENAACMVIADNIFAMLLVKPFFASFLRETTPADATKHTEVLVAISADSRQAVDEMTQQAISAGGSQLREPQDHGWMYARAFTDLDGHIWEVVWTDPDGPPTD